ncbi:MAG: PaaI family thioesterase [Desulfobacteraceae bacterium]|nr:MAG: PaaI family thioesterase [Desulfobacteraceae bacterium]
MTADKWKPIPNLDKNCFGCGKDNPTGLKMTFESNSTKVRSRVTVPEHMRGWNNIVHGGILSTICDEIMAWSAIYLTRKFILTRNLNITFLKPVIIETELTATGMIKTQSSERHAILSGEIRNPEGERVTACEGEFILFSEEQFRPLNIVPEKFIDTVTRSIFTAP